MDPAYTETYKGWAISIYYDDAAENPRKSFDHLGTLTIRPQRGHVDFSDKNAITMLDADDYRRGQYAGKRPGAFMYRYLTLFCDVALALPVYDSSCGVSTDPDFIYDRTWDDDPAGFIYITKAKLKEEYGDSPNALYNARTCLVGEIVELGHYIEGEVYGYTVARERPLDIDEEDPWSADVDDSCWGYYGDDDAMSAAKEAVDYRTKDTTAA